MHHIAYTGYPKTLVLTFSENSERLVSFQIENSEFL